MSDTANRKQLNDLFRTGRIRLQHGPLFDRAVSAKSPAFDFGRIEGMLLGIAIGDALGVTTESMLPARRRARYGELRDYLPNRYTREARGFPSDDTQLAFWTLEQLIVDRGFIPERVTMRIARGGRIFGIGATVRRFLANFKAGVPWHESGPESAGNGALMRIAPILVPHLRTGGTALWADTALAAMMTHNDVASNSACLAFVAMLWELLDRTDVPAPHWWVERYAALAKDLEGETAYTPRGGRYFGESGPLWRFVETHLPKAHERNRSVEDACNDWYSGAFLLETVPSALYILMRHAHEPEEALVRAVNDTKDNDTIAAIVGAAVGALHGKRAFPQRWVGNLSGRTTDRDDGRVFELMEQARAAFWEQ